MATTASTTEKSGKNAPSSSQAEFRMGGLEESGDEDVESVDRKYPRYAGANPKSQVCPGPAAAAAHVS